MIDDIINLGPAENMKKLSSFEVYIRNVFKSFLGFFNESVNVLFQDQDYFCDASFLISKYYHFQKPLLSLLAHRQQNNLHIFTIN